jgi:hypothetical protein
MMVAAGGNERGLIAVALRQFEAQHTAIEAERALEISDLEVDVTDPGSGGDRDRRIGHGIPPWLKPSPVRAPFICEDIGVGQVRL